MAEESVERLYSPEINPVSPEEWYNYPGINLFPGRNSIILRELRIIPRRNDTYSPEISLFSRRNGVFLREKSKFSGETIQFSGKK